MKTMLLRILRRVAYYKIGICYFKSQPLNKDVYAIGWRNRIKPHYACHSFEHAYTEKDAIERLAFYRRKYILDYVSPRIKARNLKRYNKKLKKL